MYTPEEPRKSDEDIIAQYGRYLNENGCTLRTVARRLGVSYGTLRKYMYRLGLVSKRRGPDPSVADEVRDAAYEEYRQNPLETVLSVAQRHGVSENSMRYAFKKAGFKMRSPGIPLEMLPVIGEEEDEEVMQMHRDGVHSALIHARTGYPYIKILTVWRRYATAEELRVRKVGHCKPGAAKRIERIIIAMRRGVSVENAALSVGETPYTVQDFWKRYASIRDIEARAERYIEEHGRPEYTV